MATSTQEILPREALAAAYDLGDWQSVDPIVGGKSQHVRLRTSRGQFVVRRSYRAKTPESMQFEHEIMAYLRARGYPATQIVPTRTGGTWVEVGGRLFSISVFVAGTGFQAGNAHHLRQVAGALARYHQLIASFGPTTPMPAGPFLNVSLRDRLEEFPRMIEWIEQAPEEADATALLQSLPYALDEARRTLEELDELYPRLPILVTHAGCRRGSVLFDHDRLAVVLDFDSSRPEARALDLAVALHDVTKIYGDPASADFKVPLDLGLAEAFMSEYRSVTGLEQDELRAIPALLIAKRLKRALGRYERLVEGENLSQGDIRKIGLEVNRVRWLGRNRTAMEQALAGGMGPVAVLAANA